MDKNKFKEILTIIDSNKFGHKNKIGDFKYIDIKDLVKGSDIILTGKTLMSSKDENEKLKEENKNENDNENENEKLKEENKNENENEDEDEYDYENEDEEDYHDYENQNKTTNQNKKMKQKKLNDHLDEIIDKSKSFKGQIELLKKIKISRRVLSL